MSHFDFVVLLFVGALFLIIQLVKEISEVKR